jgi:hypothetical protein
METYFFHTDTDNRNTDIAGVELESAREARVEAIKMCGQMMHEAPDSFWGTRPWSVTVTDQKGLILWIIDVGGTSSAAALALI